MVVYIGEYSVKDLRNGVDKRAIAEAQEKPELKRNGIKYILSKYDKKRDAMKIWLTDTI